MPSIRTRNKKEAMAMAGIHLLSELKDIHKGDVGVVIGNGYSASFYDTARMKADGCILFGCNYGFKIHPLDYLLWQDSNCRKECQKFCGNKILPFKEHKQTGNDNDTTYYFQTGKLSVGVDDVACRMRIMNTGGLALQAAIILGCDPIVMVGCDCRFFTGVPTEKKCRGYKGNMFEDKQAAMLRSTQKKLVFEGDIPTTPNFQLFAKRFIEVYNANKDRVSIFQMGDWSIMKDIPTVEWPEYWTDKHPGRNDSNANTERPGAS
jgi:hypothetical protein